MPKMWHDLEKKIEKSGKSKNSAYAIATSVYEKKTGMTPQGKKVKGKKGKKK